jgi:hypothetical protein
MNGSRVAAPRAVLAWGFGVAGLVLYNWWVLVLFRPSLLRSPNELFSNLEVTGQPYATEMQHADLISGVLFVLAFLAVGWWSLHGGLREWVSMVVFGVAAALGGLFPETCPDEISSACKAQEWHFQLSIQEYLHVVAGIAEFGAITVALVFAYQRTRGHSGRIPATYRGLMLGAVIAYPGLAVAYLFNVAGSIVEGIFFIGFTIMIVIQLRERTHRDPLDAAMAVPGAVSSP